MVSGPSHGCGGQGENAPEASSFESKLRAEALILEEFANRLLNEAMQKIAEELDTELNENGGILK
jgi:hypothetical protein